jgi:phage terminase large subunit-like protein
MAEKALGDIAIVGPTAGSIRDVMVQGESGIERCAYPGHCRYIPTINRIEWNNGTKIELFSAEEPDRIRGFNGLFGWCDEICAWDQGEQSRRREDGSSTNDVHTWDMLQFALRKRGPVRPRTLVTTTPRPTALLRSLLEDTETVKTTGSTYENAANLSPDFIANIKKKYEGTRLGLQEIHAEVLSQLEGALWKRELIRYASPPR